VTQVDRAWRAVEPMDPGLQVLRGCVGIVVGVGWTFGDGDVAGGVDEFGEIRVGDLVRLNPEPATVTSRVGSSST